VFSGGNRRRLAIAAALAATTACLGGVHRALAAGPVAGDPAPAPPVRTGSGGAELDGRLGRVLRDAQTAGTGAALKRAKSEGVPLEGSSVRVVIRAGRGRGARIGGAVALAGGEVRGRYGDVVSAVVPIGALATVAADADVAQVTPPLLHVADAVDGEEVGSLNATAWHAAGATGAGVKIGIIDLGFAGYAALQPAELPASVTTMDFCGGKLATATAHGSAVAEAVHEVAPDAQLYLICVQDEVSLGQAEQYAKANGISIITHSVSWVNSSRGDGSGAAGTPDAIAADARANGILWVNSAGNQAQRHWSGTFVDGGDGYNRFAPGDAGNSFYLAAGATACASLRWDAWPVTAQDYDLVVARSSDAVTVATSLNVQSGSQPPKEETCYTNPGAGQNFFVAIYRRSATATPRFDLFVTGGSALEYATAAGSMTEPGSSPATLAVGAVCWQSNALEPYSSQGPTVDGRVKPDVAGPDSFSSATFGAFAACGSSGFSGTSAATPAVAGVAALLKQRNPSLGPAALQALIESQAVDLGPAGKDTLYGAGALRLATPPDASTGQASAVGTSGATVGGTVDPNGAAANVFFEYGPTTAYGSATPVQAAGSGTAAVSVQAVLTGLSPATTYHWRLVATSTSFGRVVGADGTFTTAAAAGGFFDSLVTDAGCGPCSATVDGAGTLTARIAGGADAVDSAYGIKSFGGASGVAGRVYTRTRLALAAGQVLQANLAVLQVLDAAGNLVYELYIGPDRVLRLWSPPGGLAAGSLNQSTGVAVPNDGVSLVRVEVSAQASAQTIVRVDGVDRLALNGLAGATTGNQRTLLVGIDHYDTQTTNEPVAVTHDSVGWSATGWLGAPPGGSSAPVNTTPPSIVPATGLLYGSSDGTWSNSPTSYARQWLRCDAAGAACAPIGGATSATYDPVAADAGRTLELQVTATNAAGSATATSTRAEPVTKEINTVPPALSGIAQVGQTLHVSTGTWLPAASSFGYEWKRCGTSPAACATVSTTGADYTVASADVGSTLEAWVTVPTTVLGTSGTVGAGSNRTTVVTAAAAAGGGGGGFDSFAVDPGCVGCDASLDASGVLTARIAGGAEGVDTAYGVKDFGGASGLAGRVFVRSVLGLKAGQALTANLAVLEILDVSGSLVYELYLGPDRVLRLWSPPGGLQAGAVNASTGSAVPNDGSSVRIEVSGLAGAQTVVRVDGVDRLTVPAAAGATTGPQRFLRAGIDHYDSAASNEPVVVSHGSVAWSQADWLGAPAVAAQAAAPSNTSLPTVGGTPQVGQALVATPGAWSNNPSSYAYLWRRCDGSGAACVDLTGQTGQTYVPLAGDAGSTFRVRVTASNAGGSAPAESAASGVVAAAPGPFDSFTTDQGCTACSAVVDASGVLTARIGGGADAVDTAYGVKLVGGSAGLAGRVYTRTLLGLGAGQALTANLAVFQAIDQEGATQTVVWELYVAPDRTLRLWSPADGLAAGSVNASTGVVVPNDGTSVRVEVSALANASIVVRVDGVERLNLSGFAGASVGNLVALRAGIDHYDSSSPSEPVVVTHAAVAYAQSDWLGAP
jgi:hypothetical protein